MTGIESGADAVRSSDAAHRSAPNDAQPRARTAEELSAVRFFWGELLLVAAMSIGGNIVHALLNAPTGKEWVAAFVASFPPIALLAATHGVGLLVRAQNKARLAYWAVVLLTAAIAAIAFRLSFDALMQLAIQVGMSEHLAFLFPLIIDGAIGQATIALLVLARNDRAPTVRAGADPVHRTEPVRTVSVREVRTETHATATEIAANDAVRALSAPERTVVETPVRTENPRGAERADQWASVAELICRADPAGRRDPDKVTTILRLKHEEGWSHARIAEHVDLSSSSVTRTLTAAQEFTIGGNQ